VRKLALHHWILIAMAAGAVVGLPLNLAASVGMVDDAVPRTVAEVGHEVGEVFLRLLQMLVVPLIVSSLITGVTSLGSSNRLGRLAAGTFAYYLASTTLAIATGLLLVNLIRPGAGVDPALVVDGSEAATAPLVVDADAGVGSILWEQLKRMVPTNPLGAAADGDMLPIIFFTLLLGVAILAVGGRRAATLRDFFESLFHVMMKMTLFVLRLAPLGVLGFMLHAAAGHGLDAFRALGMYVLTAGAALAVHALVTLPVVLWWVGRRPVPAFASAMSPALVTAFSTASSNGTLPLTLRCIEERAHVDTRVSSFVLPLGATINMDGTALYEVVAVLFIAQVLGADLALGQQLLIAATALLVSIGAAGIPHAGTLMLLVVLQAVGLPTAALGLILAVDRVLDMARTAVNVWSDSVAAAVVARWMPPADP
jgi:proton glutamate symport protein